MLDHVAFLEQQVFFFVDTVHCHLCIEKVHGKMTCMIALLRAGVRASGLVGSAHTGCSSAEGFEDMHQVRSTHTNDIISGLLCV